MKYYSTEGLLNTVINKLSFETSCPKRSWDNKLYDAYKEHDVFYSKEKYLTRRLEVDKVLGSKAFERFKASDAKGGKVGSPSGSWHHES